MADMTGLFRCLHDGCDKPMFYHPDKGAWYCLDAHVSLSADVSRVLPEVVVAS